MNQAKDAGPYIGIGVACLFVVLCFLILTRHICLTKCIPYYRRWKTLKQQQRRSVNYRLPPQPNFPPQIGDEEIQPRRSEQPQRNVQERKSQPRRTETQPRSSEPLRVPRSNQNAGQNQEEFLIELYLENELVDQVIAMSEIEDQVARRKAGMTKKKKKKSLPRQSLTMKDQTKKQKVLQDNKCYVCFNQKMDKRFIPCQHRICSSCAPLLTKCPLCRKDIESIS